MPTHTIYHNRIIHRWQSMPCPSQLSLAIYRVKYDSLHIHGLYYVIYYLHSYDRKSQIFVGNRMYECMGNSVRTK